MQLFQKQLSQANLIKKVAYIHAILGSKTTKNKQKCSFFTLFLQRLKPQH